MGWSNSRYGEAAFMVLVGKPEGRRPLGRLRRRREDNIKMDLQEEGLGTWIDLVVGFHKMWGRGKGGGEFLTSLEPVSFLRRTLLNEVS